MTCNHRKVFKDRVYTVTSLNDKYLYKVFDSALKMAKFIKDNPEKAFTVAALDIVTERIRTRNRELVSMTKAVETLIRERDLLVSVSFLSLLDELREGVPFCTHTDAEADKVRDSLVSYLNACDHDLCEGCGQVIDLSVRKHLRCYECSIPRSGLSRFD